MKKLIAGISAAVMAVSLVTGTFSDSVQGLLDKKLTASAEPVATGTVSFNGSLPSASKVTEGVDFGISSVDGIFLNFVSSNDQSTPDGTIRYDSTNSGIHVTDATNLIIQSDDGKDFSLDGFKINRPTLPDGTVDIYCYNNSAFTGVVSIPISAGIGFQSIDLDTYDTSNVWCSDIDTAVFVFMGDASNYYFQDFQVSHPINCDLTLNANGGQFLSGDSISTETMSYGAIVDAFDLQDTGLNLWYPGYSFVGWYTTPTGAGTLIQSILDLNEDTTLFARWNEAESEPESYSITYHNLNNSSNSLPTSYTSEDADIALTALANSNLTFLGWYSDAALTNPVTSIDTASGENLDIYAAWTPISSALTVKLAYTTTPYTGNQLTPAVTKVKITGIGMLDPDTDFTATYGDNINAGDHAGWVNIEFTGEYGLMGSTYAFFTITPAAPTAIYATGFTGVYDGQPHTIEVHNVPAGSEVSYSATLNGTYTTDPLYYMTGTHPLYYKVTNPNYAEFSGSAMVTINSASIAGAAVTLTDATGLVYDGDAKTPTVASVKLGATTLAVGTDYTYEYSDNTAAGTATVTITGQGGYTGTVTKTFTILPHTLTASDFHFLNNDNSFVLGEVTDNEPYIYLTDEWAETLSHDIDFSVSYIDNTAAGKAYAVITGMRNTTGTVMIPFYLTAPDQTVTDLTITGITAPTTGAKLDMTINSNSQINATVADWVDSDLGDGLPEDYVFTRNNGYSVEIILTAKSGYTLSGLPAFLESVNYFTVEGATMTFLFNDGNQYILIAEFDNTAPITLNGVQARANIDGSFDFRLVATIDQATLAQEGVEIGFCVSSNSTSPDRSHGNVLTAKQAYKSIQNNGVTIEPDGDGDTYYFVVHDLSHFANAAAVDGAGVVYVTAFYTIGEDTYYTAPMAINLADLADFVSAPI
ncbi:MAG: InlB B-repeat-containing protein [Oscillospiraceae bacterium]